MVDRLIKSFCKILSVSFLENSFIRGSTEAAARRCPGINSKENTRGGSYYRKSCNRTLPQVFSYETTFLKEWLSVLRENILKSFFILSHLYYFILCCFYKLFSAWVRSLKWIEHAHKIRSKIILRNHKVWSQISFLVFTSLPDFLTKQIQTKTDLIIRVLSRYDCSQLNIKLPKKEYRILASQDRK